MSMKIVPTSAVLGAEIAGVDLSGPLDDATFAAIERAYDEHGVIFFRKQSITPAQQVAFTRRFGEIEFNIFGERWSVPGHPEIDDGGRRPRVAAARSGTRREATRAAVGRVASARTSLGRARRRW